MNFNSGDPFAYLLEKFLREGCTAARIFRTLIGALSIGLKRQVMERCGSCTFHTISLQERSSALGSIHPMKCANT
ncbi:hypothetical protein N9D99_03510 [Gammaproteobacteria bacterium]|nr:hypothetical protein [Gammaproteobacteria bacterium]